MLANSHVDADVAIYKMQPYIIPLGNRYLLHKLEQESNSYISYRAETLSSSQ